MAPVSPVTKTARQAQIAGILTRTAVRSQDELSHLLTERGVTVTQATLSRDLEELGAVRLRGPDGALVYALPEEPGGPGSRPGGLPGSLSTLPGGPGGAPRPDAAGSGRPAGEFRPGPGPVRAAGPGRVRIPAQRGGQREPGRAAVPGRRGPVPRLGRRPRRLAVDPRHRGR